MIETIMSIVALLLFAAALFVVRRAWSRMVEVEPEFVTAGVDVQKDGMLVGYFSGTAQIEFRKGWVDPEEL